MKKILFAIITMSIILTLSGCGGGNSSPQPTFTQIFSDPTFDGDIRFDATNVFTITQGNFQSVFAGVNPNTGSESRAFLDFPLTGAGGVPGSAIIDSAILDIFIDSHSILPLTGSIPIRIELVSFTPPTLVGADYGSTALTPTAIIIPIFQSDIGQHILVDVTSLMVDAQRAGLLNFQIRILEDLPAFPGLVEINDATSELAPLLKVTYF